MSFLTIIEDNESFEYSPIDPATGERMATVFVLRVVPDTLAKELRRQHTKPTFENHQRVEVVDQMAFASALLDAAIVDWRNLKSARSNTDVPCTPAHKTKLPQRVKDEIVQLCVLNEAGEALSKVEQ